MHRMLSKLRHRLALPTGKAPIGFARRNRRGLSLFDLILALSVIAMAASSGVRMMSTFTDRAAVRADIRQLDGYIGAAETWFYSNSSNIPQKSGDTFTITPQTLSLDAQRRSNTQFLTKHLRRNVTLMAFFHTNEYYRIVAIAKDPSKGEIGFQVPNTALGVTYQSGVFAKIGQKIVGYAQDTPIPPEMRRYMGSGDLVLIKTVPTSDTLAPFLHRSPVQGRPIANQMNTTIEFKKGSTLIGVNALNAETVEVKESASLKTIKGDVSITGQATTTGSMNMTGTLTVNGTVKGSTITTQNITAKTVETTTLTTQSCQGCK